jgi:hypothetical protein
MTLAALNWPDAVVWSVSIAAAGFVLAVLIWSIFRTGQTAIKNDGRQRELIDHLGRRVDEPRAGVEQSAPSAETN